MTNSPAAAPENQALDITIVITCYNEEAFITDTIENVIGALREVGRSYEVIVVDDVSRDNSVRKVREYMEKHPDYPITLKANEKNRGLASNYIDSAFFGTGKYFRLCCGDDCESKEVLVKIFRHIGEADMIIPYQIQTEVVGKTATRKYLSMIFTFLVNTLSGYKLIYYNGLAIHLRYNIMRWHPSSYGFGFQADIVTRLLDEGASYLQVPSSSIDRKGSASGALTMRNVLSVGHTLLEVAIRRLRRFLYAKDMTKPIEIKLKEDAS